MCKFKVLFRYKLTTNIKFKKKTWFVLLLILLGKINVLKFVFIKRSQINFYLLQLNSRAFEINFSSASNKFAVNTMYISNLLDIKLLVFP